MIEQNDKHLLLKLAADSIQHGLEKGKSLVININDYSATLQTLGASFVTLNINAQLRGCIGCLEAYQPLAEDVSKNAFAAAFRDPRFPPLEFSEYSKLEYHISILGVPEEITISSEKDLLDKLVPGVDGLIIEDHGYRATFLPSVWESLRDPQDFLSHLKQKAGLPVNYWSNTLSAKRYSVEDIE